MQWSWTPPKQFERGRTIYPFPTYLGIFVYPKTYKVVHTATQLLHPLIFSTWLFVWLDYCRFLQKLYVPTLGAQGLIGTYRPQGLRQNLHANEQECFHR